MKTILYNPIFINPQAYYVFPRLTRYLQPDNESTSEPANYIGTIEVKVIAYGDTTLKRTYTNTDSIDLSEFKNTWIRISLFTKVGSCVLGEWKIGNMESDLPYIDPEVLASLKAVVIVGNKTNNDSDRAIVKNLVDASNPFVISNAAFKLNSGFGKYETELSNTRIWTQSKETTSSPFSSNYNGLSGWIVFANTELTNSADMPSFKIQVKGLLEGQELIYRYYDSTGQTNVYSMTKDGKYTLPADVRTAKPLTSNTSGFQIVKNETNTITITQIPSFVGAFVTDGINDIITSTKTVQEMLGGSNEFTVVSMMANLDSVQMMCNSNYNNTNGYNPRNTLEPNGVISMLGYTDKNGTTNNLNLIMGDKDSIKLVDKVNFNSDYVFYPAQYYGAYYKAAWYWTVIANKVLTTDQINQVIAYFNLDRTLKPDILCNTIKQGITNENHAEFGDKLIDFSGNGRDIQLNNIAWKGDSGIGKYNFSNINIIANRFEGTVTTNKCHFTKKLINTTSNFCDLIVISPNEPIKFKVSGLSDGRKLFVANKSGSGSNYYFDNGEHEVSLSFTEGDLQNNPFGVTGDIGDIDVTVEFIPSHAGALCLDGVNDFGKVTGLPIYKDYTIIADYERFYLEPITGGRASILSKSSKVGDGSFIFNLEDQNGGKACYTFGEANGNISDDITRIIRYQSKYYNTKTLSIGTAEDNDFMVLGKVREADSRYFYGAIYSLMSFPYSMSEFLIERQLKKHKLGTLYPDMVEFRPVIKTNVDYTLIQFYINNYTKRIYPGDYIPINTPIEVNLYLKNNVDELISFKVNGNDSTFKRSTVVDNAYNIRTLPITKSPQKIDITIDEYIRYEDIVQPYPVLLRFKDENGNEVSWGGKFKVGSTITRIGSAADSNLLPNIYNIFGLLLNGNQVTSSKVIVEKTMVFKAKSAYIFDNNEPKCILSPRLLRIPNSSYKILGYIPDISGHGNHGVIHNSAYAEGSGVNEDGSYQLDGVDDFVTIPTLSSGGKQVLMKVNWNTIDSIIYDQRGIGGFAIYCSDYNTEGDSITVPAYKGRNAAGTTYIDGIRNEYVIASQLRNVTHNIVEILDTSYAAGNINPIIGKSNVITRYGSLALYDFMLFDNISTDDKIKELNEYVGIEAKVELPPYYWDAYGKTNLDGDKATIQQRGVAVGDYDLTNNNLAYEGMSGYNGYPVVFGTNKTYANLVPNDGNFILTSSHNIINVTKFDTSYGLLYSHIKLDGKLTSRNIDYPSYKIKVTGLGENFGLHYSYLESSSDTTVKGFEINNDGIYIIPKSFASDGSLTSNSDWIGFIFTGTAPESCNVTIEVLPEYENGLVYDGITNYSKNANIPALDDFTAIIKREWLKKQGCPLIKGSKVYEGGNGNALLLEWDKAYNFVFYKRTDIMEGELPDNISFITPTNYNGNVITRGSEQDTNGICIAGDGNAGFANMVFYKLILYPKTIPLLQINFLKNLMERDEIIDLNNKIFIQE